MEFTLDNCIQRINQILNYPSLTYGDVSHFFDQAIAELNTVLKISVPSVTEIIELNKIDVLARNDLFISRSALYTNEPITQWNVKNPQSVEGIYYDNSANNLLRNSFKVIYKNNEEPVTMDEVYVAHNSDYGLMAYKTVKVGNSYAYFTPIPKIEQRQANLLDYLPMNFWILFVIPYVCFKFAVRNGDSGDLYQTEFVQGLQQLQTTYDVKNFVILADVAGREAYTEVVKNNLDNLNIKIPTRAIYETMRVGNAIRPEYGNFYNTGGWGV